MNKTNNGGPAFPLQSIGPEFAPGYAGMTLRDYLAAKAMQAVLSNMNDADRRVADRSGDPSGFVAKASYAMADAMLKAREA